ncbi:NAD(P)-binding protein [Tothia fuscella]|uniref:NAD(P)-binding protein n=1 Tax=Tothia fuscella TaxID=1048955 RepID=A0A9P4TWA9_9PEZI|nr:NAD(P)-binding protein [Tothia fuscella]
MLGASTSKYYSVHAIPRGANDARPTALQVVHDDNLEGKCTDKTILVTGGSASIGAETVRALHATGATVFMTVRDTTKAQKVIDNIFKSDPSNEAPIHMITMSLDQLESIRQGAREFLKQSNNKLNILICNAGVMATPKGLTSDGFETQFGTNYGEINFDDYKLDTAYNPMKAYGQSKTALIYVANTIDRRFGSQGLHALSLHPGAIKSNITSFVREMAAPMWEIPSVKAREKNAAQGAATTVYAAVSQEWEGKGGKYLSNCMEMGPFKGVEGIQVMDEGYAPWVYDEAKQERLWEDSLEMVGIKD